MSERSTSTTIEFDKRWTDEPFLLVKITPISMCIRERF